MSTSGSGASPLARLLGSAELESLPAGTDYRDASDATVAAINQAARRDPERFFAVLDQEPTLSEQSDVVWALGFVNSQRAIPVLLTALRSQESHIRRTAVSSLAHYRDDTVVDALIAALSDRAPTVRELVIAALGQQGSQRAIPALRAALARPASRKSPTIQKLITEALARLLEPG